MGTLLDAGLINAAMATFLAVCAAGLACACRRPALTHGLWVLVLLKLLTPSLVPVPLPWSIPDKPSPQPEAAPAELVLPAELAEPPRSLPHPAVMGEATLPVLPPTPEPREVEARETSPAVAEVETAPDTPAPTAAPPPSWRGVVAFVWLAGSLVWFGRALFYIARFRRLLRHAQPPPAQLQERVSRLAGRLGLRRCPAVWLVPGEVSPMVWALGRAPRLLFPARLLERLDEEQQATLFVHELAHVRRRNHWVRFVELLATGLYWWHPVVWWARREVHEAEEQCCDAWVVWSLAGAGRAYALALLQTVDFFSRARSLLPVGASGIGPVPHLRRRLTMIMQAKTPRSLSWAGCAAVFGLGLLALPLLPVRGQPPAPPPPAQGAASQDARDREIEALKSALRILEDQKRAEQADRKALPKADPAEVKKAKEEADQLAKQVEVKRQELQAVTEKYKLAVDRLSRLTGTPAHSSLGNFNWGPLQLDYGWSKPNDLSSQLNNLYNWSNLPQLRQWPAYQNYAIQPPGVAPAKDKKTADIEKKLDQLFKEVEELRREIKRGTPKTPPAS
jgi:beta-lactamase regulating signal transducer with metallopeptidase domain